MSAAVAMGCEWMTAREAREAIPPAFTEHIGAELLQHLNAGREAEALEATKGSES